jgi:hypothetical protein
MRRVNSDGPGAQDTALLIICDFCELQQSLSNSCGILIQFPDVKMWHLRDSKIKQEMSRTG